MIIFFFREVYNVVVSFFIYGEFEEVVFVYNFVLCIELFMDLLVMFRLWYIDEGACWGMLGYVGVSVGVF